MSEAVNPARGAVVTDFDGERWCNRVVGSYTVADLRDTAEEAVLKGRATAQMRRVAHLIMNRDGQLVSHIQYD